MASQLTISIPKLPTKDLEATKQFYNGKLGFAVSESFPDYLILKKDQVEIHFFLHRQLDLTRNIGMAYVRVQKVDEFYNGLKALNLSGLSKLETKPWRQKEFVLTDNQNNQLTFGEKV